MKKVWLILLVAMQAVMAQHDAKELTEAYLKSDEAMREDEYAKSLKRRNWLNNRVVFSGGAGSKYAMWGAERFSVGVAADYITPWTFAGGNPGLFVSYGILAAANDASFEGQPPKESAANWRVGLTYTFLPKIGLHPGISISYGTAYYDFLKENRKKILVTDALGVQEEKWEKDAEGNIVNKTNTEILLVEGFSGEFTLTYLTDSWYYFSLNVGASYSGKPEENGSTVGEGLLKRSKVIGDTENGVKGINLTIGAGFGFALPELFPDKTEIRYRQRMKARKKFRML